MTEKCEHCGLCIPTEPDRPAGLSEDPLPEIDDFSGRLHWLIVQLGNTHGDGEWQGRPEVEAMKRIRASRAPLEAENTKLRAAIKDLERQRDGHMQAHGALAERFENLRAQLAQAQKPAPAGLPEVNEPVEVVSVNDGSRYMRATVKLHCQYNGEPAFEVNERDGLFPLHDPACTWRRLPPAQTSTITAHHGPCASAQQTNAQTSRDVNVHRVTVPGDRTAASQSGEVSTENFDKLDVWELKPHREIAREACVADIRANVERVEKPLRGRIAELSDLCKKWAAASGKRAKERDAALAEVERLRGELARAKEAKRCPADGMSAERLVDELYGAWLECPEGDDHRSFVGVLAKARELFTPVAAPAQPERKVPRVGDPVWCRRYGSIEKGEVAIAWEDSVFTVNFPGRGQASYNTKRLGETWWWDDPGAKGEG